MKTYQVVGIGNAIVDVFSAADDSFLELMGIEKGIMQLVERERGELLYGAMKDRVQAPGGSVANTLAGLGNLGLTTAFIGRVHDDALGRFYARTMAEDGTDFVNAPVAGGELPTSRSMIFVSPDGERSMNTYLGISSEIGPRRTCRMTWRGGREILFLEGYLYDKPKGKQAFERAAQLCHAGAAARRGLRCRTRSAWTVTATISAGWSRIWTIVIGNEHEWCSLYQTDLAAALEQAAPDAGLVACTRSGHDVIVVRGDEQAVVPVHRVVPVDATGAGDQFAAGFLYGLATGQSLATCGRMGCVAAAEVISHFGARPETDLKALFRKEGLI